MVIDGRSIVEAYTKRRLPRDFGNSPPTGEPASPQSDAVGATAELSQLSWPAADRCDVFPVAFGVEVMQLNRRGTLNLMLCAAIRTTHRIYGRTCRPDPSKKQLCAARTMYHSLQRSWHRVGLSPKEYGFTLRPRLATIDLVNAIRLRLGCRRSTTYRRVNLHLRRNHKYGPLVPTSMFCCTASQFQVG